MGRALRQSGALYLAELQLCRTWPFAKDFDTARELYQLYQTKGQAYDKQRKEWYDKAIRLDPGRKKELIIIEPKGRVE
jgi:hypothetical protein